ncbi:SixA phosphatase family protein [Shewanella sedimentimangrovi]|uniref:Histidine phosphatase family protein n=1 Tax=Shewanella sedimentimangrovi TaxID=2814293 RepID=A0ABX7QZB8_9GAMM|nr:histidine phosphatase family protein [Shewanella sedimentimangrovi]QSX36589.1 histidine phosphatase family protein [Shewanella sedimentimangrovi]
MKWIPLITLAMALCQISPLRAQERMIFLLRHAEKQLSADKDPQLSEQGQRRARDLVRHLHGIPLEGLIASQFIRTQATLTPLSEDRKLPIRVIPLQQPLATSLADIASQILQGEGNWVVAGHSNTLGPLIEKLGGPEIAPISENEYNKLFQLTLSQEQVVGFKTSHYGEPNAKSGE